MRTTFLKLFSFLVFAALPLACKYSLHLLGKNGGAESTGTAAAPAVVRVLPAEFATAVGTNTKIHVGFDTTMAPATLSVNTADTNCTGTIQLSADDFVSCVRMASLSSGLADMWFSLTPASNLAANTRYKVRVTAAPQSIAGVMLAEGYLSAGGFTTAAVADTRAPVIQTALASFVSPFDTATNVPLNAAISVQFSEPVDPATLTVNTGDTVCSGNIQLSRDLFVSCIQWRAAPAVSADGKIFTVFPQVPLAASSAHRIRIASGVRDLAGNGVVSALVTNFTTGTAADNTAFSLLGTSPANGATGISVSPAILLSFSAGRYVDATTVSVTSTSACTGSVQLSADSFATCVPLLPLFIGPDFENAGFRVAAPLSNATAYKFRITADLRDVYGNSINAFTQSTGFTTTATTTGGGVVSFLEPADNSAASNDIYGAFTVNFTRVMNPATLTAITAGTTCSGSFMVSADNFTTCLPMSAQPIASVANTRFTVLPQAPLTAGGVYRTRISTAAQDAGGGAVALYNGSGITVMP